MRCNEMATPALVDTDLEKGRATVEAITAARIPLHLTIWAHFSEAEQWRLLIVTPLVDRKGPRAGYAAVGRAIRGKDALPLHRLVIVGRDEQLAKLAANSLKANGRRTEGEVTVIPAATILPTAPVDLMYADGRKRTVRERKTRRRLSV